MYSGAGCQDLPSWRDSNGRGCMDYALHPERCSDSSLTPWDGDFHGVTPQQACCVCRNTPQPHTTLEPLGATNPCPPNQLWGGGGDWMTQVQPKTCPPGELCAEFGIQWWLGGILSRQPGIGQTRGCWKPLSLGDQPSWVCGEDAWCKTPQCPQARCRMGQCHCGDQCKNDVMTGRCVPYSYGGGVLRGQWYTQCMLVGDQCTRWDDQGNHIPCDPTFCGVREHFGGDIEYFGQCEEYKNAIIGCSIALGAVLLLLFLWFMWFQMGKNPQPSTLSRTKRGRRKKKVANRRMSFG